MRILYVSPYPPARDGIGDYTCALATAMQGLGHDVAVLVPRPVADRPAEVIGAVGWRSGRRQTVTLDSIAAFRPDVVHVQFGVAAFGARTIALLRWLAAVRAASGVPVIVTMHEVTRDTRLLGAAGRALYRRMAGSCDQVIVHTEAASTVLCGPVGAQPAKVAVIPHPAGRPPAGDVEPAELRARFGLGDARILLAFGFIHVDKGLQDLVAALGVLRRDGAAALDGVLVVVAGAVRRRYGPMRVFEARDRLHLRMALRRARRAGVRDRLVLTGYVPDSEVTAWFSAAEAAVLPYRRIEQSGVASMAIALGVPVLASRVGGLDELFGASRWTFPAREPDRLARTIADFLGSPPLPRQEPAGAVQSQRGETLAAVAAVTAALYDRTARSAAEGLARVG
jgi:glycosyltransferase involved in cell wall biosynthesis